MVKYRAMMSVVSKDRYPPKRMRKGQLLLGTALNRTDGPKSSQERYATGFPNTVALFQTRKLSFEVEIME